MQSPCAQRQLSHLWQEPLLQSLPITLRIKSDFALNRPVEDWGKLLGDSAAVTAMLDRLLHHGHILKCGPRSWRTKIDLPPQQATG